MRANTHEEEIICPECERESVAEVEHTIPFPIYGHICPFCEYIIMESEWNRKKTKKYTDMLIFNDQLKTERATPPYYLQALIDGEWTTIHTVTGEPTGTVEVNEVSNKIQVNTELLKQGETYDFRWIDDNGTESNITSLLIPTK